MAAKVNPGSNLDGVSRTSPENRGGVSARSLELGSGALSPVSLCVKALSSTNPSASAYSAYSAVGEKTDGNCGTRWNKLQIPNTEGTAGFRACGLEFLWFLELGRWCFHSSLVR